MAAAVSPAIFSVWLTGKPGKAGTAPPVHKSAKFKVPFPSVIDPLKVIAPPAPLATGWFSGSTCVPFVASKYAYKSPVKPPLIETPLTVPPDGMSRTLPPNATPAGFPSGIGPTGRPLLKASG